MLFGEKRNIYEKISHFYIDFCRILQIWLQTGKDKNQQPSFCKRYFFNDFIPLILKALFKTRQYNAESLLFVNTATTSIIEKYHFSSSSLQTVRIFLSPKSWRASL